MIHHKVELSVLRESNLPWWNAVPRYGDETQPGSVDTARDAGQSH
jgi:hypothetical protein